MTNRRMLGTLLMASLAMVFGTPALPQAYRSRAVTIGSAGGGRSASERGRIDRRCPRRTQSGRRLHAAAGYAAATSPIPD